MLQPEYGEPSNPHEYLPSLTADRDKHIGDDLILQVSMHNVTRLVTGFRFYLSHPYFD